MIVSLRNFIRNEKTLECDFYPEAQETDKNKCHIIIDKQTEEIVSVITPDSYECSKMDSAGARIVLAKYINSNEFPDVDYYICG